MPWRTACLGSEASPRRPARRMADRFGDRAASAKRSLSRRPCKQAITIRLDADVLRWFRARSDEGQGYQTAINAALRAHIEKPA